MLAIIDYGVGNLFSLASSLSYIGVESVISSDPEVLRRADRLILPGVGAFGDAAKKLRVTGLDTVVREEAAKGKPLMGICLGMQLLFEKSYEYGEHDGLGLLPGEVVGMKGRLSDELMIPHIGWNALELKSSSPLFKYIKNGDHVYFVHSFFVPGDNESTVATAEYGLSLTATVQKNNVCGCQFHPEKSGEVGLSILRAFCEM
ncbi:MAG: imidazole glycerol phosphate synthase subunit HisH [Clostridia bacterium]|nr:imidazole glycerol phosphate synthase subunit HisH [Clostridia bacterium]